MSTAVFIATSSLLRGGVDVISGRPLPPRGPRPPRAREILTNGTAKDDDGDAADDEFDSLKEGERENPNY